MSGTLGVNKIKVEATGTKTTVTNDNIAKLMYYLDCVLKVIEYDRSNKLTNYEHYYNLNNENKKGSYSTCNYSIQKYLLMQVFLLLMRIYFQIILQMNFTK